MSISNKRLRVTPPADVQEAFRATVYDYGVPEMAAKIGIPAGTLYNKSNLNESSTHKPSLSDALLVQVVSGDTRVVEAMAFSLGGTFLKLPVIDGVSDTALMEMLCRVQIESGQFHKELQEALGDKKFSREEFASIRREALQYVTAILEATWDSPDYTDTFTKHIVDFQIVLG